MRGPVAIQTGARLHFGLFDTQPGGGRQGGIGMMVDQPGWTLRGTIAERDEVIGEDAARRRVEACLEHLQPVRPPVGGVRIEITSQIPAHRGLGSGTQLALAVAELLRRLELIAEPIDKAVLGRGRRSLVGSLGFQRGGFVVDPGGISSDSGSEARVIPVPEAWRMVIVEPHDGNSLHGSREDDAFARLPPVDPRKRAVLSRLVERRILPGLEKERFAEFADGLGSFNRLVGEQFAAAQGGIYAHPLIRQVAVILSAGHWFGLAQSSWGASATIPCRSKESARTLFELLDYEFRNEPVTLRVARPLNRGAS